MLAPAITAQRSEFSPQPINIEFQRRLDKRKLQFRRVIRARC